MELEQRKGLESGSGVLLWKRILDLGCLLVTAPCWVFLGLVIAAIVKTVSRGPIFFKQERIGYQGKTFTCFKFRTMRVGADTKVHAAHLKEVIGSNQVMTKLDAKGDPRLIRFGLLLRSVGLDELPQFLNVLKGEMSLVGPRPCLPYEYAHYLPRHRRRFDTLPGLTGLWQISGKNRTTFEEMIDLDIYYAERKNLLLDLKIMILTSPAIILQVFDLKTEKRAGRDKALGERSAKSLGEAVAPESF